MELDDIKKEIDSYINAQNRRPIDEFEGYSPHEMHYILNFPFDGDSPVQLQPLPDSGYLDIPILNQVKYMMDLIDAAGEIKLTNKGFLPTKVVADIYQQGFMKDELIEEDIYKLYKETDSMTIHLGKLLMELAGLTKKRNGKLSLTKASGSVRGDNQKLLRLIFQAFTQKFNWPYFDGHGENQIGQLGFAFSLILLHKYGGERRLDSFYAEKYFKAFPRLLVSIEPKYGTVAEYATRCYSLRTFERFLCHFGLVKFELEGIGFEKDKYVTKTALFDKLVLCRPHK